MSALTSLAETVTTILTGLGALLLVGGLFGVATGARRRLQSRAVEATPRAEVRALDGDGASTDGDRVHVRGEVVPATGAGAEPFSSPVAGDPDCVLAAWQVRERPDTDAAGGWDMAGWGVESVPFYVDDGTGRVLVDPGTRETGNLSGDVVGSNQLVPRAGVAVDRVVCEFDSFDRKLETDYGEDPPERLARFLDDSDAVNVGSTAPLSDEAQRRYSEGVLSPGDEVSVLGRATADRADPDATLAVEPDDGTTMRVSTRPLEEASGGSAALWTGLVVGALGAVLLAVGVLA